MTSDFRNGYTHRFTEPTEAEPISMLTIRDVRVFALKPTTENLVVVKVETSEPELFGLGDATFTQRHAAVVTAVETYLRPLLIGRDPLRIDELWQLMHQNSYWRNGPVLNNAISGVDQALWDIKGKLANMPVYQLWGGKCREAAAIYRHAQGATPESIERCVKGFVGEGVRHVRVQVGPDVQAASGQLMAKSAGYGGSGYGGVRPDGALDGVYIDATTYVHEVVEAMAHVRSVFGQSIELLHDVHERLAPNDVVTLAKMLEPHRMFFLEDPLPPERLSWLSRIRDVCTTPIAIGELFVHPAEWLPLVERHELDFIRMHISSIGGATPARKAAIHAEMHDVRTAWHCPKDIAPIGVAANLHLDLVSPNFGIQEFAPFTPQERQVFDGLPELRKGYLYPNERPGWGITMDEEAARRFPTEPEIPTWTQTRRPDGSLIRP